MSQLAATFGCTCNRVAEVFATLEADRHHARMRTVCFGLLVGLVAVVGTVSRVVAQPVPQSLPNSQQAPAGGASQAPGNEASASQDPGLVNRLRAPGGITGPFRELNISMDLLFAIGTSTARDEQLLDLKGGEHDPRKRGITIQQAELQLNGEVDKWFTAQGVLVTFLDPEEAETVVELEEAFLQSNNLPYGLQVKAGHYFTEFGRINPLHPHAWDWQDQPVILSRVFGPEGMRAPGARLSWLAPTHQYLEFFVSAQNANGGTMTSFLASDESYEERPIGGRLFPDPALDSRSGNDLVWTGRVATTFQLNEETALGFGVSAAFGPNATGADESTRIYGADFAYQWRPVDYVPGSAFVRLQGEYIWRDFESAAQVDANAGNAVLPADTLRDHGGYLYALVGWDNGFAAGVRCDYASGSGQSYLGGGSFGRQQDAFRTDRLRVSPLVQYQISQFTRMRLQYDYDDSDHLFGDEHSIWLGFEVMLGQQPPARLGRDGLSGCGCR